MIETMNAQARTVATEMAARFPDATPEQIRFFARFAVAGAAAINVCNAKLAEENKCLSQKGVEFCLSRAAELAAS